MRPPTNKRWGLAMTGLLERDHQIEESYASDMKVV
jgi:hypothetical protein